jgi:sugar lactone lactonase YvrE
MSIARMMQMAAGASSGGGDVWTDPDLANASYDSVSFSVAAQDANPRSVAFSEDGSTVFMVGITADSVYQFSLASAWDVSTASYDSVSFFVGSQETSPNTIVLGNIGSSFYVIGYGSVVYQYDMTTPDDLSTASYASKSLSTGLTNATGLSISKDGTKLYATSLSGVIQQFSMSTAWDVSTASSDSKSLNVSDRGANTTGIFLALDGTKVFTTNLTNDSIYEYSLSTLYDISTGSYTSTSFSVAGQEVNPWSFTFKTDGSKMYVIGNTSDRIHQYSTA